MTYDIKKFKTNFKDLGAGTDKLLGQTVIAEDLFKNIFDNVPTHDAMFAQVIAQTRQTLVHRQAMHAELADVFKKHEQPLPSVVKTPSTMFSQAKAKKAQAKPEKTVENQKDKKTTPTKNRGPG